MGTLLKFARKARTILEGASRARDKQPYLLSASMNCNGYELQMKMPIISSPVPINGREGFLTFGIPILADKVF